MTTSSFKESELSRRGPMARFSISIDEPIWQKINYWVQKAPGEVSGLGKLVIEGGHFRVIEAVLVKQENGAASTDLDPADVARAMYELRDTPGHLNFWWHSHVYMGVFWSGTDLDTIREIGQHGFVVSTVFNKRREFLSSVYVKEQGLLPEIFVDQVPTQIQSYLDKELTEEWDKEYDAKCTVIRPVTRVWPADDFEADAEFYPRLGKNLTVEKALVRNNDDSPEPTYSVEDPYLCLQIIEDWGEDMESSPHYREAQSILAVILRALNKLVETKEITNDEALRLKDEYLSRFNVSRMEFRKLAEEVTEEKVN